MRKNQGFTLIELMIVVAIIAIIASIAIPNLLAARLNANESAAIATLRNVVSGESQVQSQGAIDVDLDGIGEHAFFAEMAGSVNLRAAGGAAAGPVLTPPVLAASLGIVNGNGDVNKSGFYFKMYLPDNAGDGISETGGGGSAANAEDPEMCETVWICYAWPARFNNTGNRAFVVNHSGDVLQTANIAGPATNYSGTGGAAGTTPAADAASTGAGDITVALAIGGLGQDGNTWTILN